jgi:Ribbon-helix-helix protein, copG family
MSATPITPVRLSAEDRETLERLARVNGVSLSEMIRMAVRSYANTIGEANLRRLAVMASEVSSREGI